jgi:hypothetical protein
MAKVKFFSCISSLKDRDFMGYSTYKNNNFAYEDGFIGHPV